MATNLTSFSANKSQSSWRLFWLRFGEMIIFFALVIVALIGYYTVIHPSFTTYKNQNIAQQTVKADIAALETQQQLLRLQDQQLSGWSSADIGLLEQALPEEPRKDDILIGLDALVSSLGFEIVSLTAEEIATSVAPTTEISSAQSALPVGVAPLKIALQIKNGSYAGYKILLTKLERYRRLLHIDSFRLAGDKATGQSKSSGADFSLVMTSYYSQPAQSPKQPDSDGSHFGLQGSQTMAIPPITP